MTSHCLSRQGLQSLQVEPRLGGPPPLRIGPGVASAAAVGDCQTAVSIAYCDVVARPTGYRLITVSGPSGQARDNWLSAPGRVERAADRVNSG
ncbi:unnamed protein product [Protopolystoma xenopodis]|uniref:Uncharacterized protein n=1 Tax=Protopolystoma xenopodis TaxID=117903 RepID=A0A448X598_9PLAT|nr:unnamed protein product [Protopolystoma xenopodis]